MGKFINNFDQKLKLTAKSHYQREQYQSYMTGPEWRNVEMVEEYGAFLKDNRSMFQFPYFSQVFDLWRILFNSFKSARKYNTTFTILMSDYMTMDLFVAFFTTMELIPRGIIALFLRPFLSKENKTPVQRMIADYYVESAEKLKTIPFYDHEYQKIRKDLKEKYNACQSRTWNDWFSFKCLSMELLFRGWISKPLQGAFHQEGNETSATTDILIKLNTKTLDPDKAKKEMQVKLNLADVKIVDNHLYVKDKNPKKDYLSVYACVSAPRYMAFKQTVEQFSKENIEIKKIAGQNHVQVKIEVDSDTQLKSVKPLYHYTDRINLKQKITLFDVPVRNLQDKLKEVSKEKGVKQVRFIHNF